MHLVPASAVRLMKRRVFSRPGKIQFEVIQFLKVPIEIEFCLESQGLDSDLL